MREVHDDDSWRHGHGEMGDDLDDLVDDYGADEDDDPALDVLPCPQCGADVYDDSPQCPACGSYITHSTSPWHGKPWWWVVLGLAGIAALLYLISLP